MSYAIFQNVHSSSSIYGNLIVLALTAYLSALLKYSPLLECQYSVGIICHLHARLHIKMFLFKLHCTETLTTSTGMAWPLFDSATLTAGRRHYKAYILGRLNAFTIYGCSVTFVTFLLAPWHRLYAPHNLTHSLTLT